jgi:putative effector of murein hydrolase LrgA (UPF0299 family)
VTLKRWQLMAAFVILTLSFTIGLWLVRHLNVERIHDIQHSRIYSCQKNYEASGELVEQVALFFFPAPEARTRHQQIVADNLHEFITSFVKGRVAACGAQTTTKGKP